MSSAQEVKRMPRASGWVIAAFAFVTVVAINLFPPAPGAEFSASPNELSRFDLVAAIGERSSFSIDPELGAFGRHEDISVAGGRTYSNKPPGLSFAAVPVYLVLRPFLGRATGANVWLWIYALRLATVSLASVLALRALARRLAGFSSKSGFSSAVVFAVAFGTPFLVYARSFFSHAWTASLLFLAFDLIDRDGDGPAWQVLAGLLAGWAVISEFPAAVIATALLAFALRRPRRGLWFMLGAIPAVGLLLFYDAVCFGGPFRLSYSAGYDWYATHTTLSGRFFGFEVPQFGIALAYLFSPNRGVLFASPFLLFLPAAAARLRGLKRGVAISLSASALYFLLLCGYENWHGGWALGSRYLVPALLLAAWPLVGIGAGSGLARAGFGVLGVFAACYFLLSGATFWFYPASPPLAIRFFTTHWLAAGWWGPTIFGHSAAAWIAPAAVTALAAASAARAAGGTILRSIGIGAAGLCLFGVLCSGPEPRGSFEDRLTRARILESFSNLDPGAGELRSLAPEIRTRADFALWQAAARRRGLVLR